MPARVKGQPFDISHWQHVAIGTDWPLQVDKQTLRDAYRPMARQYTASRTARDSPRDQGEVNPAPNLVGFDDYRDVPNITRGLVKRGYADEKIRGILGENFLRVFEAVCG